MAQKSEKEEAAKKLHPQGEPGEAPQEAAPETGFGAAPGEALLAGKDAQIAELKKELLYQRAEFENFRKRTEKRYRDALEFATEPLVKDLLPVLDNLERAAAHSREAGLDSLAGLVEGLEHVIGQFRQALGSHGVEDVLAHGEKFDPNFHESLAHVPGEEENRVAQVYEKGYLLKGRLLRPAKVAISKVATGEGHG